MTEKKARKKKLSSSWEGIGIGRGKNEKRRGDGREKGENFSWFFPRLMVSGKTRKDEQEKLRQTKLNAK